MEARRGLRKGGPQPTNDGWESVEAFRLAAPRRDFVMRSRARILNLIVAFSREVLELPARCVESIVDCYKHVLLCVGAVRGLAMNGDIRRSRHGKVNTNAIRVALVMSAMRTRDHDAGRGYALVEFLKLGGLGLDALFDGGRWLDVLECDLNGHLHLYHLVDVGSGPGRLPAQP
jgi:hypothetical protein